VIEIDRNLSQPSPTVTLDFDAKVPVPFSIFPSSYRSDVVDETARTRVEGEVTTERVGREGHETRYSSFSASLPGRGRAEEEVKIYDEDRSHRPRRTEEIKVFEERERFPEVELARDRLVECGSDEKNLLLTRQHWLNASEA